jgi:hypothetical protein
MNIVAIRNEACQKVRGIVWKRVSCVSMGTMTASSFLPESDPSKGWDLRRLIGLVLQTIPFLFEPDSDSVAILRPDSFHIKGKKP